MSRFTDRLRATALWALTLLIFAPSLSAQLISQGQETTISYTSPTAVLATNTPALNFAVGTGTNTFVFSVNPTVSARVSITNETANACLGAFTVAMAVSADSGVTSFNNSLQSWQSVALINSTGQLAISTAVDLPALSTIYISSTAISAPRLAVQVVNTTNACSNTNIDVRVTTTSVAVTSPLVSVSANGAFGGTPGNVQGVIPFNQNGGAVFPVIAGTLGPAINQSVAALGIDNFSTFSVATPFTNTPGNANYTIPGTIPAPSSTSDWGLVFYSGITGTGGTGLLGPWTCISTITSCGGNSDGGSSLPAAQLPGITSTSKVVLNVTNNNNLLNSLVSFVEFNKTPTIRQALSATIYGINTLQRSTLVAAVECNSSPCAVASITDTQTNTWTQIQSTVVGSCGAATICGLSVWVAQSKAAAADTITVTMGSGAASNVDILELSGITPASVNQPAEPFLADANNLLVTGGNLPGLTDPCQTAGALKQSKIINIASATTTQLVPLVAGQSVYVCGGGVTMVGAAQTLALEYGTGASCGTGTTLLTGAMADGAASDIWLPIGGGSATSFSTPSGNALCAVTTGTVGQQGYLTYVQQ
jgi:hypothetical protein